MIIFEIFYVVFKVLDDWFAVKDKFTNLIWRSQFPQFYYFVENITKARSTYFKVP